MFVEQRCLAEDGGEISLRAKFNLVDLAGSEKWNVLQEMDDDHISEMNNINLSLHTLGRYKLSTTLHTIFNEFISQIRLFIAVYLHWPRRQTIKKRMYHIENLN